MTGFKGGPVSVDVTDGPAQRLTPEKRLELKISAIAVGRTVTEVRLEGEQLFMSFDDGGKLQFLHPGGVREVD